MDDSGRAAGMHLGDGPHDVNIAAFVVDRHVRDGRGERTAFRFISPECRVRAVSYGELARLSNRCANALAERGVAAGDTVFMLAERVPELYIAILGALKVRATVSVLFANFGDEPILTRLAKGRCRLLVAGAGLLDRHSAVLHGALPDLKDILVVGGDTLPTLPGRTVAGWDSALGEASDEFAVPPTDPEQPAFLFFTSGTAGAPKGAIHVHGAARAQHETAVHVLGLGDDDVYWCTADPGWVTGIVYGLVAPLAHGLTAVVDAGCFDAARWYRIIAEHRVNVLYTAPTAIRLLMSAGVRLTRTFDLRSLRLIASVGEALHPEVVRWGRQAFGIDIRDTWWQTETGAIMLATPAATPVVLGAIGTALPGIEAAVVRRSAAGGIELISDANQVGELALKAGWPSMFRGYYGEEARYRQSIVDGWYLTGDLVSRDGDGRFWFVSRTDELIKSAGQLIGPLEVERCLVEHPQVEDAAVIGKPDPLVGEVVKAFVVPGAGVSADEELRADIIAFARRRLGPALAPREVAFVRALPKTRSGKILRRCLQARELGLIESDSAFMVDDDEPRSAAVPRDNGEASRA